MKASRSLPQRTGLARVVIADDHELARAGLRSMLAGDRGLELVGEASNGHEAVMLCRQLQPDLAVLDVRMPEMDGLAATRAIKQQCPKTSVLIVTTHEHYDYLLAALKAGASRLYAQGHLAARAAHSGAARVARRVDPEWGAGDTGAPAAGQRDAFGL